MTAPAPPVPSDRLGVLPAVRRFVTHFGPPLAVAYFIMIGGTQWGEFVGWLQVVNWCLAAVVIGLYVTSVPRRHDLTDRLVLLSLVVFLLAAVVSPFPRQSLDAALWALAWVAVFHIARGVMAMEARRRVVVWTMRALSAGITAYLAWAELAAVREWLSVTGGALPPIGLPLDGRPWGHEYDLATLTVLLYPSWLVGPTSRARVASAVLVGLMLAFAIVLMGGRAVWLAVVLSSALLVGPRVASFLMRESPRRRYAVIGALGAVAVVGIVLAGPIAERLFTSATIDQRLTMWSSATEAWLDRPLAGHGPGSYVWALYETNHFALNSGHHRHPHNAIFQLLAETGILGVVAVGVLVIAVLAPLLRARQHLALWPIGVFLFAGIGSNPTEYPFLILPGIIWAAFGLPRTTAATSIAVPASAPVRRLAVAGVALIGVATAPALAAGVMYDNAVFAMQAGAIERARDHLASAAALDPATALYWRQLGIAEIVMGDNDQAIGSLRRAVDANPADTVSWRALAIGQANRSASEAVSTLDRALLPDRSDPTNLLLLARWQAAEGNVDGLGETLAEAVLAWPTLVFAPGWHDLIGDHITSEEVIAMAIERWRAGEPSPEPIRGQPYLLAVIAERPDLFSAANVLADGQSNAMGLARAATAWCEADAADLVAALPAAEMRSESFWATRIQLAAQRGESDAVALAAYDLLTRAEPSAERASESLNPLRQNNTAGAFDAWGYGRLPIGWPNTELMLPSWRAGYDRWLLDPAGAREELALKGGLGSCP